MALLVYVNIAVKRVLGNPEIIRHFISGFCDQEGSGIVEELDRGHLVLFIHQSHRLAHTSNGLFDQMIQQIVHIVGDLTWFLFFVDRGDKRMKSAFYDSKL